ncbi:MAG: CcmD family protein [SAR202 cluster bacterium]|jgi:CcmD family protein|nr:CcmD family protein [SAR202 cluster bacterium]|tara:strand:+ start:2613 stop:2903 length:291 start_codon:yes stop_codon:yes gene_type:complete
MLLAVVRKKLYFLVILGLVFFLTYPVHSLMAASLEASPSEGQNPEANLKFLFAVFFLTWIAFFAYVFFLSKRLKEMTRELQSLKKTLAGNESYNGK